MIRIPQAVFLDMVNHAKKEWPIECCGLLAGRDGLVTRIYRLDNQERSQTSYLAAPEQQFQAFTELEDLGLDLLAIYHSHPDTECYPSRTDIEKAYFTEAIYMIVSLKERTSRVRAFRITPTGAVTEEEFEVV
jgi:proteasome lid subunit RPN8/RPN11